MEYVLILLASLPLSALPWLLAGWLLARLHRDAISQIGNAWERALKRSEEETRAATERIACLSRSQERLAEVLADLAKAAPRVNVPNLRLPGAPRNPPVKTDSNAETQGFAPPPPLGS